MTLRCKRLVVESWEAWLTGWSEKEATTLISLLRKLRSSLEVDETPCM